MSPLEARIGYKFRNTLLLAEALTHPSLGYESKQPHFDNQRLEFLGDAVLQLVFTEQLYQMFPGFSEGQLTKLRARLVSRDGLRERAGALGLGQFVMMGRGEEASGGRTRASVLANAYEALIGALYLDGGFEAARQFTLREARELLTVIRNAPREANPKGELQELLQALSPEFPRYEITESAGPDHSRTFRAKVLWRGSELGFGRGVSKKDAETEAAKDALTNRVWETQLAGHPVGAAAGEPAPERAKLPEIPSPFHGPGEEPSGA